MIPEHTTNITMEMIRQVEIQQRELQKELEIYDSWIYQILIYFARLAEGIRWKLERIKNLPDSKTALFLVSKRDCHDQN